MQGKMPNDEAGESPAFLLYLQAYEEAMDDIIEDTLECLFPDAGAASNEELNIIRQLSQQMHAMAQKTTRSVFDDTTERFNLRQTLDNHQILKEKKLLMKNLSRLNQQVFKYDEEDKIEKLANYLKEVSDVSQLMNFHKPQK